MTEAPALSKQEKYFEAMTAIIQQQARLIDDPLRSARERIVFVSVTKEAPA